MSGVELSPLQGEWKNRARQIAETVLAPSAAAVDREGQFPRESMMRLAREGFLGLGVPKGFGGIGADVLTTALVTEELAKGCPSTGMCFHMHTSTVPLVAALARGAQVERFVKPIARGEWLGAIAQSEPGSGSRVWHADSYAEEQGNTFVLHGAKSFCTNAGEADYYLIPVRSHKGARPDEMSIFLYEGHLPRESEWEAMGLRGSVSSPLKIEGLQIPRENRLGEDTDGFPMIVAFNFPSYQVGLSAVYVGIAEAAFTVAFHHAKKRVYPDTGTPMSAVESVQRHIAGMRIRIDRARAVLHRVARLVDRGVKALAELARAGVLGEVIDTILRKDDLFLEIAEVKVIACETAIEVANLAMSLAGGAGFKQGHPAERLYRDARAGSLMAPNDDALKVLIGKHVLGYPFPWEQPR